MRILFSERYTGGLTPASRPPVPPLILDSQGLLFPKENALESTEFTDLEIKLAQAAEVAGEHAVLCAASDVLGYRLSTIRGMLKVLNGLSPRRKEALFVRLDALINPTAPSAEESFNSLFASKPPPTALRPPITPCGRTDVEVIAALHDMIYRHPQFVETTYADALDTEMPRANRLAILRKMIDDPQSDLELVRDKSSGDRRGTVRPNGIVYRASVSGGLTSPPTVIMSTGCQLTRSSNAFSQGEKRSPSSGSTPLFGRCFLFRHHKEGAAADLEESWGGSLFSGHEASLRPRTKT